MACCPDSAYHQCGERNHPSTAGDSLLAVREAIASRRLRWELARFRLADSDFWCRKVAANLRDLTDEQR